MKTGISTSSLFVRYNTEDALELLAKRKVKTAEIFLESYCDYNLQFGKLLKSVKGDIEINSIHTLTTQFEPQLYSINKRANEDSFKMLKGVVEAGREVGAKYYTFHGLARYKVTSKTTDYERVGKITQDIIDYIKPYGIQLAYENVQWGSYNHIGFFEEMKKRTVGLKGTLDIKQADRNNIFYGDFIKEMGGDIVTVHLSDKQDNGKMCLPGKGITDFNDIFLRLKDVGFNGAILIESYPDDYKDEEELFSSYDFVTNLAEKIF